MRSIRTTLIEIIDYIKNGLKSAVRIDGGECADGSFIREKAVELRKA